MSRVLALVVGVGGLLALVLAFTLVVREPDPIPTPPPGQEYCVTGDGKVLGFCDKE
jgi:hypothetical protein